MPNEPIIRIEDLHFTYPGDTEETLRGLSLDIAEGSFVAVLGHNGSGKSTLAKLLNAILLPTSGHIYVAGVDTADESRLLAVRGTVGLVFQNPDNQIVANVVEDDVAFAPENLGVESAEIRRRVGRRSRPSACTNTACTRRTCSPAGRSSAWPSPALWPCTRACWCWTSPRPCWTPSAGGRSSPPLPASAASAA